MGLNGSMLIFGGYDGTTSEYVDVVVVWGSLPPNHRPPVPLTVSVSFWRRRRPHRTHIPPFIQVFERFMESGLDRLGGARGDHH